MSDLLLFELKVKSRTTNIQKLKPVDPQTMKNSYAIGYVRTCVDPFRGGGTRGKFGPILGPKNGGFFINYIRIVWFMWDLELVLFYIPKVAFFGKILFFGIIFDFPGVNWAPKWVKTVSFGYVLFPLKDIILKDYSYATFVLWCSTSGPYFNTIWPFLWKLWSQNPPKWAISWMFHCHENIWTFITWEPQML